MLHHGTSNFYYARTPVNLTLKIQTDPIDSAGSFGIYTENLPEGENRISILQDSANHPLNLDVVAHEYGHYIHDTYGYRGNPQVIEGWADSVPLRMALYEKHVTGTWTNLFGYGTYLDGLLRPHTETAIEKDGLIIHSAVGGVGNYYPEACTGTAPNNYLCGNYIRRIYWELAWDSCVAPYGICGQGTDILQTGPYWTRAWEVANSAFAYAIANISSTGNISSFFDLVAARYWQFYDTYGFFGYNDYIRVSEVLARHCLGWNDYCRNASGHTYIPGTVLPYAIATKAPTYREAETATWNQWVTQSQTDATATAGIHAEVQPYGTLTWNIPVAQSGSYRIRFTAARHTHADMGFRLLLNDQLINYWQPNISNTSWQWHAVPMTVSLSAGTAKIAIEEIYGKHMKLDAIYLEKL